MKKLSPIFDGTAISGLPAACSVSLKVTRCTLSTTPPEKPSGTVKTISIRWLAGIDWSVFLRMVILSSTLLVGIVTVARTAGCAGWPSSGLSSITDQTTLPRSTESDPAPPRSS